jgi:hypothetical protein
MAIRIDERLCIDEPLLALATHSYFLRTLVEDIEFFIVADDSATPQQVPVRYDLQHIREEFKILRCQRWTANALPAARSSRAHIDTTLCIDALPFGLSLGV